MKVIGHSRQRCVCTRFRVVLCAFDWSLLQLVFLQWNGQRDVSSGTCEHTRDHGPQGKIAWKWAVPRRLHIQPQVCFIFLDCEHAIWQVPIACDQKPILDGSVGRAASFFLIRLQVRLPVRVRFLPHATIHQMACLLVGHLCEGSDHTNRLDDCLD